VLVLLLPLLLLLQVDGILVQLPLPKHINEQAVLDAISIDKDVDGFHPQNIGSLAMRGRDPMFVSCTPKGCMELLKRSGVQVSGKTAAVVGRSNIVGLPAALLLQNADATVTMVHSRTPNAEEVVRAADIVIAACGKAEMVKVRGRTDCWRQYMLVKGGCAPSYCCMLQA
jgi:5,10-methylene-tetrahydrofolate dehydrogenase/methenyl tetrahydrofolate cyclohydrolase